MHCMQYTHIIIHFGEVILKGANRRMLEKKLIADVEARLSAHNLTTTVQHGYGRLILSVPETSEGTLELLHEIFSRVPGIANFAFASHVASDIAQMKEVGLQIAQAHSFDTFKINTQRSHKAFPHTSQETNEQIGAYIQNETSARVDLTNPDWTLHIAITEFGIFLYSEKYAGMGGLPLGASGHGLALFSGGIDSPVAAYLMMKRGMPISAVHFHSRPKTSPESIEKVRTLLQTLAHVQPRIQLHLVPLLTIQKRISAECTEDISLILQRRFMMRIAERIAQKENGSALVTGESLGQVASQTIQNMHAIGSVATNVPILRPLVGFDKQEIMNRARDIGTFETSILPHEDCCTAFLPERPKTKAHLPAIEKAEETLNIEALVDDAIAQMETEEITFYC